MARILALSSWVGAGHVGLSAIAPALQALGHEVIQLPSIVLSNHKAWPHAAGEAVAPAQILAMAEAIAANGWLAELDAALIGYLPSPAHVDAAVSLVERVRGAAPDAMIVVDPVLGDDPKGLYVPEPVALAVRGALAPLADVLTPNRFELSYLAAAPAATLEDGRRAARRLAEARSGRRVLVTSPPLGPDASGILEVTGARAAAYRTPLRADVPKGPGDVFAGLIAAGLETGRAAGLLAALVDASLGKPHLALNTAGWRDAEAIRAEPVQG